MPSSRREVLVPSKKIVFVLVEGPSDRIALEALFNKVFPNVYIHVEYGDITTHLRPLSSSSSILSLIGNRVSVYLKNNNINRSRIIDIIHIVDTDGAYIPDDAVVFDEDADSPVYTEENIRTKDTDSIRKRNRQKRDCLDKLTSTSAIWGIPFHIYFMSSNLDHVISDAMNLDADKKKSNDVKFALKYRDDCIGFLSFLENNGISVCKSYRESWEFVKADRNSLKRFTNINICFSKEEEKD